MARSKWRVNITFSKNQQTFYKGIFLKQSLSKAVIIYSHKCTDWNGMKNMCI